MRAQARASKLATRLLTPLAALPLALAIALPSPALAQSQRTVGDLLSLTIPVATVGTGLFRGDREGALQYALTFATATGGTEVLKREHLGVQLRWAQQLGLAKLIAAVHCEDALGEIDADGQNGDGLPLPKELMRFATPSRHFGGLRLDAAGLGRDGEVPFI